MKGKIVSLLLFLAALSSCEAASYEEKKKEIHNFMKCVACEPEGSEIKKEYLECSAMKPERLIKAFDACKEETMPEAKDLPGVWETICKDVEILDKVHHCLKDKFSLEECTPEELEKLKKYKDCAMKVNEKCK